jgi:hypothetical protein
MGPEGVEEDGADAHGVEGLHDGVEHLAALDALHVEVGRALARFEEGPGVDVFERIGLGDADVLERFHGDAGLADVGGEIPASEFLDFFGDQPGGDDAERREGEGDEGEFPVDEEHDAEREDDGARFLDQVGEAELEEIVEGAVGLDAAMSSLVVVFWKKSSERELILRKASFLTSLVMRWPLQAMR